MPVPRCSPWPKVARRHRVADRASGRDDARLTAGSLLEVPDNPSASRWASRTSTTSSATWRKCCADRPIAAQKSIARLRTPGRGVNIPGALGHRDQIGLLVRSPSRDRA